MTATELHSKVITSFLFRIDQLTSNGVKTDGNLVVDTTGFESVEIVMVSTDDAGDGTFILVVKHGDTNVFSSHTDVLDEDLLGSQLIISSGNEILQQGYIGKKRFLSANIIASGVTSGRHVGVIAVADSPRHSIVSV